MASTSLTLPKRCSKSALLCRLLKPSLDKRKSVLIVGTKKQAKIVVRECAEQCGEFYVSERWLGGMLTNLSTIRNSVKTLERIEKRIATGGEGFTKERTLPSHQRTDQTRQNLSGIRAMRKPPGLVIVVDPSREHIAVAEANKLGIPVMGLVDTNCDPDPIDYVIACNDDALKSIKLILSAITQAIIDKKNEMQINVGKGEEEDAKERRRVP